MKTKALSAKTSLNLRSRKREPRRRSGFTGRVSRKKLDEKEYLMIFQTVSVYPGATVAPWFKGIFKENR